jgi:nitrilase
LQIDALAPDSARLDYLITQAKNRGSRIAVLPEYAYGRFFKELETTPLKEIKKAGAEQYANLSKLARQYNVTIIAPLVRVALGKPIKTLCRFSPDRVWRHDQQILINYQHWNEAAFFADKRADLKPPIFVYQGFRVALLFGFELHFDLLWHKLIQARADIAIVSSVCAFESFERWRTLCKARAFTGGCYLLRANRIGSYDAPSQRWAFYGDSLYCNPFGEIENSLDDREGILVAACDRAAIKEARRAFRFGKIARGLAHSENDAILSAPKR